MNLSPEIAIKYNQFLQICKIQFNENEILLIEKAFSQLTSYLGQHTDESEIIKLIEVAEIAVLYIGLRAPSIIAVFLFDLIERKLVALSDIENHYGKIVTRIIDGLVKLSKIDISKISSLYRKIAMDNKHDLEIQKKIKAFSENFIKLLLTLADDPRSILLRLAFRLQLMNNLENYSQEKQFEIAAETQHSHTPLAHLLGLYKIKADLEELSMRYLHPDIYFSILNKVNETKQEQNILIEKYSKPIRDELIKHGFHFSLKSRTKSIYSIWNKMKKQKIEYEEIMDILAIRIILKDSKDEKADCWRVYSIVTDFYKPSPERLRDWISAPKISGYESLHATVKVSEGKYMEVQIRTERMDEIAENGVAAHWRYKEVGSGTASNDWLHQIRSILESANPTEFENFATKANDIFVFTPKLELLKLPANSTVLDFAYSIHSEVGAHCMGGIVNGKMVNFKYILNNGDKVEIQTSKLQKPKREWLDIVISSKAKAYIKRAIQSDEYEASERGKDMLKQKLNSLKLDYNQENLDILLDFFGCKKHIELFQGVGSGVYDLAKLKKAFITETETDFDKNKPIENNMILPHKEGVPVARTSDLLVIDNLQTIDYSLAKCCNPVWGDKIFGFVTVSKGTKIHKVSCPNANDMYLRYPYRIIDAQWTNSNELNSFLSKLRVKGKDSAGIVNNISHTIFHDLGMTMNSINIHAKKAGAFEGTITVLVPNKKLLEVLISKLKKIKGIDDVFRVD